MTWTCSQESDGTAVAVFVRLIPASFLTREVHLLEPCRLREPLGGSIGNK